MIKQVTVEQFFNSNGIDDMLNSYIQESRLESITSSNPQKEMYKALEENNILNVFGAYNKDKIIGFVSTFTSIIPKHGIQSTVIDSIFVEKLYRNSGYGYKLILKAKEVAKERDSKIFQASANIGGKLDNVFKNMKGMEATNVIYTSKL
jgi:GNAT superfamily N-acetyltransferase